MLEKREKHLQTKIEKELKTARENAQKNKKGLLPSSLLPPRSLLANMFPQFPRACAPTALHLNSRLDGPEEEEAV